MISFQHYSIELVYDSCAVTTHKISLKTPPIKIGHPQASLTDTHREKFRGFYS